MSEVWARSQHKGTPLLLMLALADWSADDGSRIWPSVASMARKTRMGERNTQYVLQTLLDSAELVLVRRSSGAPGDCNEYRIDLEALGIRAQSLHPSEGAQSSAPNGRKNERDGCKPLHPNRHVEPPVNPSSEGEWLSMQQVCEFLLPMFGIPAGDFLKLGGEVQHQVGLSKITREEADALLRFYRLPHDSKYPEVKSRKQKLSRFMPEYREQIALALKICAPRKPHVPRGTSETNTVGANLRPPEPTSEPEREAIVQRGRASLAELRRRLGRGDSVANGAQNGDIDAGRPAVDTAGDSTIHQ